ncbi:hypothetical protein [Methanocella sp. MCL-LM]|uniref:hypothetical protein n=1 Tax=Methanocella sp. MCL-LM TaxID=3412035 RepID=UPI003C776751
MTDDVVPDVDVDVEALKQQVVEFISGKKGHIADLDEVLALIGGDRDRARSILDELTEDGQVSVVMDSVILNSDRYLPKVRCLICDRSVKRDDLVPFYREKHFPFVNWGFHKDCLEGGALDEMLSSGMFRTEDGKIYPNYEYGEGKNPVTIAIKYLRSEDFLYSLELKSSEE